ncbi:NINE protein [Pseudoduganella sp. GCM10020061]|uniref:NINE protein n=1 Tax=Pseudoduganella sp. GCM10020061 TaxID=3317345 RepID=UPI00363AF211
MPAHKNKTLATALALLLGGFGAHRFYLRPGPDKLGLLHLMSVPLCGIIYGMAPETDWFFKILPLLVSYIAGFIEGFVIGLKPDEQFDAQYNAGSGKQTESRWFLAVVLVTMMLTAGTLAIATLARLFDLLYTGGAYG